MSTELIIILSIASAVGLIGLFYISHSIEKQRRQRALLIANLSDFAFRLQRLLDTIPAPYLGKDIQILLLGEIKKRMEKLCQLAPDNAKFRKKLNSINEQMSSIQANKTPTQKPQLQNPDQINEIRTLLQDLSKIIENFAQNKIISVDQAKRHLAFIQNSFLEANLSSLLASAQALRQENKTKVALLQYEKALNEMKKRNGKGAYSDRIEQLIGIINECKTELGHAPAEGESNGTELDQAMDEMMEEEDAWKKKYF